MVFSPILKYFSFIIFLFRIKKISSGDESKGFVIRFFLFLTKRIELE